MAKSVFSRSMDWSKRSILGGYNPQTQSIRANDLDAFVPEMWALQAVENLYEGMVFPGLVHRDFDPMIASFGDTVNTRKPAEIRARRKQHDLRAKVRSDAQATNIPVRLNQWVYNSIILGDREQSLSFQELSNMYLPEMISGMVRLVDRCVAAQALQFRGTAVGGMGTMSSSNAKQFMLDLRKKLNDSNVPEMGRNLGWANYSESKLQENDTFKSLEYNGNSGGEALRQAQIGSLYQFDNFRSSNLPSVDAGNVTYKTATTLNGAVAAGATAVTVASGTNVLVGSYITIAGDDTPLQVGAKSTNDLTLRHGLLKAGANGAAVTLCPTAAVNQASAIAAGPLSAAVASGYPAGWTESIVYDTDTSTPQVGQIVGFATASAGEYVIVEVDTTTKEIWLDRPLAVTIADNEVIGLGPAGDVNWAFHKNAVTLVNRPLVVPNQGTGAVGAVFSDRDISARVIFSYNNELEGLELTIAALFGHEILNTDLGGVIWG